MPALTGAQREWRIRAARRRLVNARNVLAPVAEHDDQVTADEGHADAWHLVREVDALVKWLDRLVER